MDKKKIHLLCVKEKTHDKEFLPCVLVGARQRPEAHGKEPGVLQRHFFP
jgi:hypothetical protein